MVFLWAWLHSFETCDEYISQQRNVVWFTILLGSRQPHWVKNVHFKGIRRKLILLFLFADSDFSFSSHMYSCAFTLSFQSLFGPTFLLFFIFILLFIWHCSLSFFYLNSEVPTPIQRHSQPLGLGQYFHILVTLFHTGDTVARLVCPAENVMLLSRSEHHSSVAATLLELSHPVHWVTRRHWHRLGLTQGREISEKSTRLLCTAALPSIFVHTVSSLRF